MMKIIYLAFILWGNFNGNTLPRYELPLIDSTNITRDYQFYFVIYDTLHRQPLCVSYMLTKQMLNAQFERENLRFKKDTFLKYPQANNADYLKSGYDKGHLAPAADMQWSEAALASTFFFTNISPQLHNFNAGKWKNLEMQQRKWAELFDTILIATGPILQENLHTIGKNKISVPEYFYKVIFVYTHKHKEAIGFIMPHQKLEENLQFYTATIDSIEKITGINFFHQIPDSIENIAESKINIQFWFK
jgi:endonuclease G, mitochondrial